ncbi:MAG: glycoside hydrolase family 28 protein, partial [Lentisphaeria bacterium]|nr:glycoside hydrolase family 28 protein [Lentisphaeria bacterium]
MAKNMEKNMVNVKDFGAIGDGLFLDTRYIQNAVDTGKIVYFPAGVYRTGTIFLKSGGGLHLSPNA